MNKEELYLDQEKKQVVWTMPIETVKEDELTWNMLQNNSIDGFLELEYYCIDDKMCLCYPYQNLQSVCSYLEKKKADLSFFRLLFENIAKLMESGASFLLPEQGYLLDIEMIFIDHVKKQVKVCYLPGQKAVIEQQMIRLVEILLEKADHHSEEGIRFIYGLYDMFVTEGFCIERLQQFLKDFSIENIRKRDNVTLKKEFDHTIKESFQTNGRNENDLDLEKSRKCNAYPQQSVGQENKNIYYTQEEKIKSQKNSASDKIRFQLQYVPSYKEEEKTKSLFWQKRKKKSLIDFFIAACRLEQYECCLDEISIGRDQKCDYSIAWERISMQHAHVGMEENRFYVMDMDSAYGTYINGKKSIRICQNILSYRGHPDICGYFIPDMRELNSLSGKQQDFHGILF